MKLLPPIAFLATLVVALGHADPALDWHWQLWKKIHGKEYRHEVGLVLVGWALLAITQRHPMGMSWMLGLVQRAPFRGMNWVQWLRGPSLPIAGLGLIPEGGMGSTRDVGEEPAPGDAAQPGALPGAALLHAGHEPPGGHGGYRPRCWDGACLGLSSRRRVI